jgi:hypothetical protein
MKQLSILAAAVAIAAGQSYIGRLDTIGGTTYDWWANDNVHRSLVNSPQNGVHAIWMYSSDMSNTTFPDRNVRYNFYDYTNRQWNWSYLDYMQSGIGVYFERAGYGVVDADSSGMAVVVANSGSGLVIARDAGPGYAVFSYSDARPGFWPDMVIGDDGTYHVAMSATGGLSYARFKASSGWDSVRTLDSLAFPTYSIAASKAGPSVCATWVGDAAAFYLLSENRGDTWSDRIPLDPPPAFGGDTVTRFSRYGLFPFFDSQGRLHIAAAVYPEVHDTSYVMTAALWHWSPDNEPHWAGIHRAGCAPEHLQASMGVNAIYADRPTLGEGPEGALFVAWEQFDSSNVEPTTSRLRADIWYTVSANSGVSWWPGRQVTERNTSSHRFPCIVDRMGSDWTDSISVLYLMDQVAGFFVMGEGAATPNPVICQFLPATLYGLAESLGRSVTNYGPTATFMRSVLMIGDRGPTTGDRAELLNAAGRKVMELHPGANDVRSLAPGVYFVREEPQASGGKPQAVRKVVLTE